MGAAKQIIQRENVLEEFSSSTAKAAKVTGGKRKDVGSKDKVEKKEVDMEDLAQRFSTMEINMVKLMVQTGGVSNTGKVSNVGSANRNTCFWCEKEGHRMKNCADYQQVLSEGTHIMENESGKTIWKDDKRKLQFGPGMRTIFLQQKSDHTGKANVRMLITEVKAEVKAEPRIMVSMVECKESGQDKYGLDGIDQYDGESDDTSTSAVVRSIKNNTGWDCDILEDTIIEEVNVWEKRRREEIGDEVKQGPSKKTAVTVEIPVLQRKFPICQPEKQEASKHNGTKPVQEEGNAVEMESEPVLERK